MLFVFTNSELHEVRDIVHIDCCCLFVPARSLAHSKYSTDICAWKNKTFIFKRSLFITDLNILDQHYITFIEFVNALSTFPPQTMYSKKPEILISSMFCEVFPLCLFAHITFFHLNSPFYLKIFWTHLLFKVLPTYHLSYEAPMNPILMLCILLEFVFICLKLSKCLIWTIVTYIHVCIYTLFLC